MHARFLRIANLVLDRRDIGGLTYSVFGVQICAIPVASVTLIEVPSSELNANPGLITPNWI